MVTLGGECRNVCGEDVLGALYPWEAPWALSRAPVTGSPKRQGPPVAPTVALILRPALPPRKSCVSSPMTLPPLLPSPPGWRPGALPVGQLWSSGSWPEGASVHRWPVPTAQRLPEGWLCFRGTCPWLVAFPGGAFLGGLYCLGLKWSALSASCLLKAAVFRVEQGVRGPRVRVCSQGCGVCVVFFLGYSHCEGALPGRPLRPRVAPVPSARLCRAQTREDAA